MKLFLKGIVVGIGGVAPGLSGCILLIIFGLYQKTLDALATLFKEFRKNIAFLLPLVLGMVTGVLLFSRVVDYLLENHEMPTRFCFFGLILGTLPMVWKEVRKEGFSKKYLLVILLAAALGIWMFYGGLGEYPQVTDPNLLQSILLGVLVAASAIIPGVDPAAVLSTVGFYEMYVSALANFEIGVLLPMVLGLAVGAVLISLVIRWLFRRCYTVTYCVIFGIFLSMIPHLLNEQCVPGLNGKTLLSLVLMLLGLGLSLYLGDLENNQRRLKKWLEQRKKRA